MDADEVIPFPLVLTPMTFRTDLHYNRFVFRMQKTRLKTNLHMRVLMPHQSKSTRLILRIFLLLLGAAVIIFDFLIDRITASGEAGFGAVQVFILLVGILLCLAAFYKNQYTQKIQTFFNEITSFLQKVSPLIWQICKRYWIFELIVFLLIAWVYLYNPVTRAYPLGYAGLFQLEIDLIKHGNFSLPQLIPYYGPGGIPAAYPFLGLYIGAAVQHFFRVSALDYLRFAPAVFTLAAAVALYFFIRLVTGSRGKALLAASLTALTYEIYAVHATAAGIVRGTAMLFMLLALIFIWKVVGEKSRSLWTLLLAGLFTALTAMTHLSYVVFLVLTAGLLWLAKLGSQWKSSTWRLAVIGFLGVALSAPWWAVLIHRYGLSTLMNASNSHGTLSMVSRLLAGDFNYIIDNLFSSWGEIPLIGFALLAVIYALLKRRCFLFFWFVTTFLFVSDRRFLILVGAVLAADMIYDLFTSGRVGKPAQWAAVIGCLLITGFIWVRFFHSIKNMPTTLNENLVSAAEWIKENSASSDQYLFFIKDHDTAEWAPYLTARVPAIGHWGSEWLGNYPFRYDQWKNLAACAQSNSLECLNQLNADYGLTYKYLIYPTPSAGEINPFIGSEYLNVYANDGYIVYVRKAVNP